MMLTELYYYYGNHPSPKVGSLPAFSLSPTTEGCALPELAADELIDGLEAALRRVTALHAHASPPPVDLARRSLAALTRARIAGRLANVSEQFAREFRLKLWRPAVKVARTARRIRTAISDVSLPEDHRRPLREHRRALQP
jgi:hypothetical protein